MNKEPTPEYLMLAVIMTAIGLLSLLLISAQLTKPQAQNHYPSNPIFLVE